MLSWNHVPTAPRVSYSLCNLLTLFIFSNGTPPGITRHNVLVISYIRELRFGVEHADLEHDR
jgi:hypothetical protein